MSRAGDVCSAGLEKIHPLHKTGSGTMLRCHCRELSKGFLHSYWRGAPPPVVRTGTRGVPIESSYCLFSDFRTTSVMSSSPRK